MGDLLICRIGKGGGERSGEGGGERSGEGGRERSGEGGAVARKAVGCAFVEGIGFVGAVGWREEEKNISYEQGRTESV